MIAVSSLPRLILLPSDSDSIRQSAQGPVQTFLFSSSPSCACDIYGSLFFCLSLSVALAFAFSYVLDPYPDLALVYVTCTSRMHSDPLDHTILYTTLLPQSGGSRDMGGWMRK